MKVFLYCFVVVTQLIMVFSESPPQICLVSDSACLKTAAQAMLPVLAAGMPDIGIEPLDVMKLDKMKVDIAGLKMDLKDVDVKGLKKAVIGKVGMDMAKKLLVVSWDTDIHMKGRYKASGRLLILPITGDGDLNIKIKKLHVEMTIPFEIVKNKNGQDVINLKGYKDKYEVKDGANFQLTNLFNGNKALSDAMLRFMNENWNILSQEFGGPILAKPNNNIYEAVKIFLKSQPIQNLMDIN